MDFILREGRPPQFFKDDPFLECPSYEIAARAATQQYPIKIPQWIYSLISLMSH